MPKYDGNTGESRLFVELSDRTACLYVNRPEKIAELAEATRPVVGQAAHVELVLAGEGNRHGLSEIPVEELLREEVQMPVEIEDDPESEYE